MPSDSGVTSSSSTSLHFAGQHAALNGGADGDDFVGVDALVRLLAEDLLDQLLHLGHARRAADQHDLVDLAGLQLGVLQGLHAPGCGSARSGDRPAARTCCGVIVICRCLGTAGVGRDERQVDVGRAGSELSSFLAFSQASCSRCRAIGSLRRSMPLLLLELVGDVVDQHLVEVVAAQVRVAVGADDLEHAVGRLPGPRCRTCRRRGRRRRSSRPSSCRGRRPAPRRSAR